MSVIRPTDDVSRQVRLGWVSAWTVTTPHELPPKIKVRSQHLVDSYKSHSRKRVFYLHFGALTTLIKVTQAIFKSEHCHFVIVWTHPLPHQFCFATIRTLFNISWWNCNSWHILFNSLPRCSNHYNSSFTESQNNYVRAWTSGLATACNMTSWRCVIL